MIKPRDIIEFPLDEIKERNYVKESRIVNFSENDKILKTIRKNGKDIQELIFVILDSEIKGMRDLSCTSINYVFEENENYLKYKEMLKSN